MYKQLDSAGPTTPHVSTAVVFLQNMQHLEPETLTSQFSVEHRLQRY